MIVEVLVSYCERHGIIQTEDIPMLKYCVEKKLYSFLMLIPLFVVGVLISDFLTFISFLGAFVYLRQMTNGYHAKTATRCFVGSPFLEVGILECAKYDYPFWVILLMTSASVMIIWKFAPFNHPNMNLSDGEIAACKNSSKKRLVLIISIMALFYVLSEIRIVKGICFGVILAAGLLGFAYIMKRRNLDNEFSGEKKRQGDAQNCEQDGKKRI